MSPAEALVAILAAGSATPDMIAAALPGSGLTVPTNPSVYFNPTRRLQGAFAPLNFPEGTVYEITKKGGPTPGHGYLELAVYRHSGEAPRLGLIWNLPDGNGPYGFYFLDGEGRELRDSSDEDPDAWVMLGKVLSVFLPDGDACSYRYGIRFGADGCILPPFTAETFALACDPEGGK